MMTVVGAVSQADCSMHEARRQ